MLKYLLVMLLFLSIALAAGCAGAPAANGANANTAVKADPIGVPPVALESPTPPVTNTTTGNAANNANLPKGATPTPGIPDDATLRKQMGIPPTNVNMPMTKTKRKLGGRIQ